MNPKISDFGMAKIIEINQTKANTNRVVGTYGYILPEYARYDNFSKKLDVFSFKVMLIEIVSGKKNVAFYSFEHSPTLAGWAWEWWKEGRRMKVIDESVRETCQSDEALRWGLRTRFLQTSFKLLLLEIISGKKNATFYRFQYSTALAGWGIEDVVRIQQTVIDCFEKASLPSVSEEEKKLLSFVCVGGGPAGVKFAAELHDFVKEDLAKLYPSVTGYIKITVIEASDHILNR
ncbi:external alternative NAD(P)H-ubiquinone oxidoreductase B4, mitochondrial-like [Pyrus x bretschneideri]|uniref:external alternative NAD(P)H-ubiquinone oxidoreductase B4, mitochondrial-like n=1 Tax=Pyrus x bretschneideri TaxID=225117 RepID=UPI00202EE62A|nr:external alternative NAD(P)H-ubiquinone oxidoreductase B4, mitochondrial-like [Pyrus x bretschneideri]